MGNYTIVFTPKAQKELNDLDRNTALNILKKMEEKLLNDPVRGGDGKMNNRKIPGLKYKEYYKIRMGDYRAIYVIETNVAQIVCVKVGNRKDVYK